MKNPASLARDQLVEIVVDMLQILYGQWHDDGSWTYAADKEWCGGDICEAAALLLGKFDLVPKREGDGEPMDPE